MELLLWDLIIRQRYVPVNEAHCNVERVSLDHEFLADLHHPVDEDFPHSNVYLPLSLQYSRPFNVDLPQILPVLILPLDHFLKDYDLVPLLYRIGVALFRKAQIILATITPLSLFRRCLELIKTVVVTMGFDDFILSLQVNLVVEIEQLLTRLTLWDEGLERVNF